jgi:hypothetical protein
MPALAAGTGDVEIFAERIGTYLLMSADNVK